jgi:DNA-directed RNA polymerase specialized sigma24 family protein
MPEKTPMTRSEQDAFLLELYAIANRIAEEKKIQEERAEDVVHDFILDCLRALRWGMDVQWSESLEEFVEQELMDRRWRSNKSRLARKVRERAFYAVIEDAPREWMSQDLKIEEDAYEEFADQVRRTLPPKVVQAHRLVRDGGLTYIQAAQKLKRSTAFVHRAVTRVQEAFRAALPAMDIKAPRTNHGGRLPYQRRTAKDKSARPRDHAPRQRVIAHQST